METGKQGKEEWRPVVGYEGIYEVSEYGDIASLNYNKTGVRSIRKPKITKDGYLEIALCRDSKMKHVRVHRVVAMAFIPNPNNLPQINHKDENKLNNHVENLEWCNLKYNVNYGTAIERRSKKISIPVVQMSLDGDIISEYESVSEAAKQVGLSTGDIVNVCNGKHVSAHGYKWRYKDDCLFRKAQIHRKNIVDRYTSNGIICSIDNIKPVLQYTLDGVFIEEHSNIRAAERKTGVRHDSIWQCCHNKVNKTHGYIFKFKEI